MFRISDSTRPRNSACGSVAICLLLAAQPATTQEDLTAPPRIVEDSPAQPEPATADDSGPLEEIIVTSDQNPWRLPDLGSAWRAAEDERAADTGRIAVDLLPIWDPEAQELPTRDPYALGDSFRRVGYIEIFRVRFGRR